MDDNRTFSSALTMIGLHSCGLSRGQEFFEMVSAKTDALIQEIEVEMGGAMPSNAKDAIYAVVERAASMSGPQLEISYADNSDAPSL